MLLVILLSFLFSNFSFAIERASGIGECAGANGYIKQYPTRFFQIPIDHAIFHNESRYEPHTNETFANRYWLDDTYYKPGGPVISKLLALAD